MGGWQASSPNGPRGDVHTFAAPALAGTQSSRAIAGCTHGPVTHTHTHTHTHTQRQARKHEHTHSHAHKPAVHAERRGHCIEEVQHNAPCQVSGGEAR